MSTTNHSSQPSAQLQQSQQQPVRELASSGVPSIQWVDTTGGTRTEKINKVPLSISSTTSTNFFKSSIVLIPPAPPRSSADSSPAPETVVAEPVPAPTNVIHAVPVDNAERNRHRCLIAVLAILLFTGVVFGVVVALSGNGKDNKINNEGIVVPIQESLSPSAAASQSSSMHEPTQSPDRGFTSSPSSRASLAPTNAPTIPPPTFSPVTSPPTSFPKRSYLLDTIGPSVLLESSKYTTVDEYDDYVTSNANSPQALALKWLCEVDESSWSPNIISNAELLERYALAVLYYATQGAGWTIKSSFYLDSTTSICDWNTGVSDDQGVYCGTSGSAKGAASQVLLGGCSLVGELPIELTLLTSLKTFYVVGNNLYGTLPPFFGYMLLLETLRLANNEFTGQLPAEIGNLAMLQTFSAYKNPFLGGSIPSEWGRMQSLVQLDLHENAHTGTIPSNLGLMTQLTYLLLYENNLEGILPTEMARMWNLRELHLENNPLMTGTVPTEFADMSSLAYFYLYNTSLTGTLDPIFCDWEQPPNLKTGCQSEMECSCCSPCVS